MKNDLKKQYEEYINWCLNFNIIPISFEEFKKQ